MPDDVGLRQGESPAAEVTRKPSWWARRSTTERVMLGAAAIFVLLLSAGGVNWWTVGRFQATTDNAYVRADISVIAAKVSGYVRELPVQDNQPVQPGDVLLRLDASDYEAAVAQARADLAQAEAQLRSVGAQRALAAADLARYRPLARSGVLSDAGMQQIEARAAAMGGDASAASAAVEAARAFGGARTRS